VVHVTDILANADHVLQLPAGRTRDRIEVIEHLANLLGDGRAGAAAGGVVGTLAGEKEEIADCDSLRVAAGGRRGFLREHGGTRHLKTPPSLHNAGASSRGRAARARPSRTPPAR